ncbi:unnamed protein product [Mytilus edulis]|uniref:Uncharacterized protein n=1 Tax=Mytilus edulis TaxID=6550 RepID=A0A8S3SNP4_MYTED|nr:unnamed protein product [Mytilus edulis]
MNDLRKIPAAFISLKDLEKLSLEDNRIDFIPDNSFAGNKKLEILKLRRNPIRSFGTKAFKELPNLKELIISEARDMTEFPDLSGSVSLRELQFDRSSISKIPDKFCDMVPAIQRLNIGENEITSLQDRIFVNNSNLRDLILSHNCIESIGEKSFVGLANLQYFTVQPAIETAILDPMAKIFQPVKKKSDILKETSNLDFVNLPSVNMIKNTSKLPKQNVHESYGPTHIDNTTSVPIQSLTINPNISAETAFQSMVQHLRKPTPEIRKFSGNPLEYRKFLRQFESKVVLNCEQDDEKMNYLEQLTFGEAHKVVSSYSHLPGDRAYKASMRHLEERYGDTDVMASAFIKKALDWPNIKSGDIQSLDEFALFLVECQYGTESMEAGSVLEYSENIKRLMSKLPFHMHDRWRNVVFRVKDSHRTVKFNDFVNFVKAEAKKATDPTYGNIAMNYSNSRSTNQQRQHGQKVSNGKEMSSQDFFKTKQTGSIRRQRWIA